MENAADCRYPEVQREYEPLFFPDGSILFNSIYGKQVHVARPPAFAAELIRACDGRSTIEELVEKSGAGVAALGFLRQLVSAGIVAPGLRANLPQDISLELFNRFETEIAHFQRSATPETSAYDYFRRLRNAKVTIIGAGGTGSFSAVMLVAAGLGRLHIVDGDVVGDSNLVRQVFYTSEQARAKTLKVDGLRDHLEELSPFTIVTTSSRYMSSEEDVAREIAGSDFVLLCADAPRFKINDWVNRACREQGIPSINSFAGLVGPLTVPGETPCFACLEKKYIKALGPLYHSITAELQKKFTIQYPSFVSGVVEIAQLQMNEVFSWLTGIGTPKTLNGILRKVDGQMMLETFAEDERCDHCHRALGKKESCHVS